MSHGTLWPIAVYFALVLLTAGGMLLLSYVLGERHHGAATADPYESGMLATGSARGRFDVRFYVVALAFVIFDLESMFVFAWAVALRDVGWTGYVEMVVFIAVLLATLVYLWRDGAFDWGLPRRPRVATAHGREPDAGADGGPSTRATEPE